MNIDELLAFSVKNKASDLHISSGMPPMVRIDGEMKKINLPESTPEEVMEMTHHMMNDYQKAEYAENLTHDFSYQIEGLSRFRINAFQQMRGPSIVARLIPSKVATMEDLGLGKSFEKMTKFPNGLILVVGVTGSGKSTTIAALMDEINSTQRKHILTIEDPIEFVHQSKKCLVQQRELGSNTKSFSSALKVALREDPDVILVGEMRDQETIRLALTAAETGHLVFATLHTASAAKAVNRIIDVFPGSEKSVVRTMLSESLQAVVSQTLLKRKNGGRVAAHEILFGTSAVRNLIREDKVAQIYSSIQSGGNLGMQTMDQSLRKLVDQRIVAPEVAKQMARNPEEF